MHAAPILLAVALSAATTDTLILRRPVTFAGSDREVSGALVVDGRGASLARSGLRALIASTMASGVVLSGAYVAVRLAIAVLREWSRRFGLQPPPDSGFAFTTREELRLLAWACGTAEASVVLVSAWLARAVRPRSPALSRRNVRAACAAAWTATAFVTIAATRVGIGQP